MTDEEYLEHYGVPGMRWGHRKLVRAGGDNTRAAKTFAQKTSVVDVKRARNRVAQNKAKVQGQKLTYKQAKKAARKTENGKAIAKRELAKYKDMKKKALRSPDRATALRLTRGEKTGAAIAFNYFTIAAAPVLGRVAYRKMLESKAVRGELKAKGKLN